MIRICRVEAIPRLPKAGWTRNQEDVAKPPLIERTGRLITSEANFSNWITTPSAPALEASRHFLDGAATPPWKGGKWPTADFALPPCSLHGEKLKVCD